MGTLFVFGAVVVVLTVWIVKTRSMRRKWIANLDLPGVWDLQSTEDKKVFIEFIGKPESGSYIVSDEISIEPGSWRISGSTLRLKPDQKDEKTYDLRLFDVGRIGIDGPDRDHEVYRKRASNIVQLRQSS